MILGHLLIHQESDLEQPRRRREVIKKKIWSLSQRELIAFCAGNNYGNKKGNRKSHTPSARETRHNVAGNNFGISGGNSHGDFATNVALIAAKQAKKNPREFAEQIRAQLLEHKPDFIGKIEIAGPGFIDFFLSREFFAEEVQKLSKKRKTGKQKS